MNRSIRIITLVVVLLGLVLTTPTLVSGKVGPQALINCKEVAFSTEEDFVTQGPIPPDGNAIISDGDLLGANCAICARNADLLETFDVAYDLGLDAADVLDVANYIVAFSTELDSSNQGQFTAGDLLVTNGAIIPNQALTYAFLQSRLPYDLGLDVVHFVGTMENILGFLSEAALIPRANWLETPNLLVNLLNQYDIDIWYSTEGTWTPSTTAGFLDGDLLSARYGTIVLANKDLLPLFVPAGIPARGVDFGLDAFSGDRSVQPRRMYFSTEILFDGELDFTDGDVLQVGDGVVAKNYDLIGCFEPMAKEVGLDALSVNFPPPEGCTSHITKVGGVDIADIDPVTGLVDPGVTGINAPSPFGGAIAVEGALCDDVQSFRVVYRKDGTTDPWESMKVIPSKNWKVKADAFLPVGPDCLGSQNWFSDADGWFSGSDYRSLTLAALAGCNPGLSLTVWESTAAVSGADTLYEMALETLTPGGVITDTHIRAQLDNTLPIVELERVTGSCSDLTGADMPYLATGRMKDEYFYQYRLMITGDGYGSHYYAPVAFYDDPVDNVIGTGTVSWNAYVGLHNVSVFDLDPNPVECGYSIALTGWDRTLWNAFTYASNLAWRCAGCRYQTDFWSFSFTP